MTRFNVEAEDNGWSKGQRQAELARRIAVHDSQRPSTALKVADKPRGEVAVYDRAVNMFASTKMSEEDWVEFFTQDTDVMWALVGDIIRFVALEDQPRGNRKSGAARLDPKVANLDQVRHILSPQYSMEPFAVAFQEILRGRSLRNFASRAGLAHYSLSRYLSGERSLTMEILEQIAKAGKVSPHFFREYRALWLARELFAFMSKRPNDSVTAVRRIQDAVN